MSDRSGQRVYPQPSTLPATVRIYLQNATVCETEIGTDILAKCVSSIKAKLYKKLNNTKYKCIKNTKIRDHNRSI